MVVPVSIKVFLAFSAALSLLELTTLVPALIWLSVRFGLLATNAFRIASFCVRPTIRVTTLRAAPAYMSFTAVSTDGGGLGRCGGGMSEGMPGSRAMTCRTSR